MGASTTAGSRAVDAYLERLSPAYRAALVRVRRAVQQAAPHAEEVIAYRMPAFRDRRILVYYAAFSDHCSLFVGSATVRTRFAEELRPFESGKGTMRFTPDRPIPLRLLTRIVKARVAENLLRPRGSRRAPAPATTARNSTKARAARRTR